MTICQQKEIIGYGAELADALERYSAALGSPDSNNERQDIINSYNNWMGSCPYVEHLCFADITFFSTDEVTVKDALTIIITPASDFDNKANYENYKRVLGDYLESKHTMAPHSVFAAGLPFLKERGPDSTPQTASELDDFFQNNPGSAIENGCFFTSLDLIDQLFEDEKINDRLPPNIYTKVLPTYEKIKFDPSLARHVSEKPICTQWAKWKEMFTVEKKEKRQLSAAGHPIHWMFAAPIGIRNAKHPEEYSLAACIFVGFDCLIEENNVKESLRYILLHLYEANAASQENRRGEVTGRNAAILPAAHELKYVISAINTKAPAEVLELIRNYFTEILIPPNISLASSESKNIDTISLKTLVENERDRAALIQKVVLQSKYGEIGRKDRDELLESLNGFKNLVDKCTTIADDFSISCEKKFIEWFRLGVLAALRNTIHHTFNKENSSHEITISLRSFNSINLLVIQNTFTRRYSQQARSGKKTGSLSALSAYARAYLMNPRYVSIKLIDRLSTESSDGVIEKWETTIPLPECESPSIARE